MHGHPFGAGDNLTYTSSAPPTADQTLVTSLATVTPDAPFTRREHEVLGHLFSALTNRQIAEALAISERTVEAHVANILGKLGLANRIQVIAWVARRGLTNQSAPLERQAAWSEAARPDTLTATGRDVRLHQSRR